MLKTSEDQAYDKLKDMILAGEFPVGEFLSQRMLAKKTGAVVITVRSCLRRLENEGLIENIPKWGVRIPQDTPEKIQDRYFMREVFETAAVKRLREHFQEEFKYKLMAAAKKCDTMKKKYPESYKEFAAVHNEFHVLIAELAGSELLLRFIKQMNLRSMMLFNAKRIWASKPPAEKHHHEKYVEIILNAPLEKVLEKVKEHIRAGLDDELNALSSTIENHDQGFLN